MRNHECLADRTVPNSTQAAQTLRELCQLVDEASYVSFEEAGRSFNRDARMAAERRDDQWRRERQAQCLIRLKPHRHKNAAGTTTTGDWAATTPGVRTQDWLENVDLFQVVREIR